VVVIVRHSTFQKLSYLALSNQSFKRMVPCVFAKFGMSKGDIYVQLTASSGSTGKSRSVIVLVPRANIERFRENRNDSKSGDHDVAKSLADPLAEYAFTHRLIFSTFEISHSFQESPPSEIKGRSPNISQSGLKAWVVS